MLLSTTVLDPEDDAATAILGAPWRSPTVEEWQALVDNCQWSFDEPNAGWKVVGRGAYNGNVIFLPNTGKNDQGKGLGLGNQGYPINGYYLSANGWFYILYDYSNPIYCRKDTGSSPTRDAPEYNVRAVRTTPL
ncbi:MAG: hypothetical protein J5695_06600 [Bacteroidales bacterium]|nr:hypothetical protein [Bacteroidales bacterium]